jgi:DNA-binding transcriptional regulator YiaG
MSYAFPLAELPKQAKDAQAATEKALNSLIAGLNAPAAAEKDFEQLFSLAQKILRLDDLEMSALLKVSRPTVGRWARGVSAPHPLARKAIFAALVKEARDQVRCLRF